MQLQYCPIKQRNPNVADTNDFSISIYCISVTFADAITSDMSIIIDVSFYMKIIFNFSTQCHVYTIIWYYRSLVVHQKERQKGPVSDVSSCFLKTFRKRTAMVVLT